MKPGPGGLTILIPAAGAASRMRGRDKLVEEVRGRALLADRVAAATSACYEGRGEVIVTLPPHELAPERWAVLAQATARLIPVTEHRSGLSASLRAAVAALPAGCAGLMVLPADMPDIDASDIARLIDAFDGETILRGASADGRPGHPVLFPARDLAALAGVTGDQGGRAVLAAASARVRLVRLPGAHALTDLDTPEDWAAWRARQD